MSDFRKRVCVVAALAASALPWFALNVGQVWSACVCEIFWDSTDTKCAEADGAGHFEYTQKTRGSSIDCAADSNPPDSWTLIQIIATPIGNNVKDVKVDPASFQVQEVSGIAEFNVTTDCEGNLINAKAIGKSDLNAYNGDCAACCSGSHRVEVQPEDGNDCP